MVDSNELGRQLADTSVARLSEGLTGAEAAIFAAEQITKLADAMLAQGQAREVVAQWTEAVTRAYGARLDERITASKELTELSRDEPQ